MSELFVTAEARARHADLVSAMADAGIPVHLVSGEVMAELAQTITPQGLLAVCGFVDVPLDQALNGSAGPDGRNAPPDHRPWSPCWPACATPVTRAPYCAPLTRPAPTRCCSPTPRSTPTTARPSGPRPAACFTSRWWPGCGWSRPPARCGPWACAILAADARGGRTLDDLSPAELAAPTAWVFGNEAWGMPEAVLALADESVAVPIYGRAESLNLATAAAVCLYASARAQRGATAGTK